MKRKSTLDRIEFNTETYEILSHTSTGGDQTNREVDIGLEASPMLGLQLVAALEQQAVRSPPGILCHAWNLELIEEANTVRYSDRLH